MEQNALQVLEFADRAYILRTGKVQMDANAESLQDEKELLKAYLGVEEGLRLVNTVGQQLLNGLTLGSTYALMALGVAMVFSILHLANFAHGELLTICGYVMLGLRYTGAPWIVWVVAGIAASTCWRPWSWSGWPSGPCATPTRSP